MAEQPNIVIIGGGFGGLYATRALARTPASVTLVDKRNHHLFQPLLYQVASGGLSPSDIAAPLRFVLRKQKNATVLLEEMVDVWPGEKTVVLQNKTLPYDHLVVAAGARTNYFGNDDWSRYAPGLKDLEDARQIRHKVLAAFEAAELTEDTSDHDRLLTFVVVGGGPTGVELAGAIAEIAMETLPKDFRHIDTTQARIILVEGGSRLLAPFSPKLSARARSSLAELGVEVWTDSMVSAIDEHSLRIKKADEEITVATTNTLWAAGVCASPLGKILAQKTGCKTDRGGRVIVEPDCSIPCHPEIYVIGDLARFEAEDGKVLPGLAPVAMQQGEYVARRIARRLRGETHQEPFRYRDKGDLATIGRSRAVARIGRFEFSGTFAWVTWLFVHLLYLVGFQNRVLVLLQWAWNYLTWNRSARLITPPSGGETNRS